MSLRNSLKDRAYEIKKIITHPEKKVVEICEYDHYRYARFFPDRLYLKCLYKKHMGKKLNLRNPITFNEKLNWLKLHNRNPLYTTLVDKYKVKEYVAGIIGEEYIIPTIGVWDRFEDIDFDKLPEKFVLKCNHDSGSIAICHDKASFDYESAKEKLNGRLSSEFYWYSREWAYKNIEKKILCEEYVDQGGGKSLIDYKFFCFNGEFKILLVATDRGIDTRFDFFDRKFEHLPITKGHPNADCCPEKPENFEKMIEIAETLSESISFVRVDLYNIDGQIYFSEMTFYPAGGLVDFAPEEWEKKLGDMIILPEKRK